MVIFYHEKERRIVERRLEPLDVLDSIIRRDIAFGVNTDTGQAHHRAIQRGANPLRCVRCYQGNLRGQTASVRR